MFGYLMNLMKGAGMAPRVSATERQALEAGTVWVEGEFFSGKPDFKRLLREPYPDLRDDEQAFLDGPVEELCRMVDDWDILSRRRIPDAMLAFLKSHRFFAMAIPKAYGGLEFSALGKSTVKAKIAALNVALYNWVSIPSSLGPAELITTYGTEAQKRHYLPRLAAGEYYPCFGLTEPGAGSDATSIQAEALILRDPLGDIKLKLNFRKRYITMAPVANLVSLACQLRDPDNLLGKGVAPGITVVLITKGTPGLKIGDWHDPMGVHLPNGPIEGHDVVVPLANVVGGLGGVGQGWRMLVECLAKGRCISLPAVAIGPMRALADLTGAYSMVREQFGIPIGEMEGVRERVARMAALTYMFEGARIFTCAAVDAGHKPAVVSALLKSSSTEAGRLAAMDAMDVFAGSGIQSGPNNVVNGAYVSMPIAVTVEGANILTRTLITFGQGAVRGHPYALATANAMDANDVGAFRRALTGWLRHFAGAGGRAFLLGLTRGRLRRAPVRGPTAVYYRRLAWCSARFAVLTNLILLTMGSRLKTRGKLSGRMADVLTWMYLALCTLRRYEAEGQLPDDLPLVEWSVQYALSQVQQAFVGIYTQSDLPLVGFWMRTVGKWWVRWNPVGQDPADRLDGPCARALQRLSAQRDRLLGSTFRVPESDRGAGRLRRAFRLIAETQNVVRDLKDAAKRGAIPRGSLMAMAQAALDAGILSTEDWSRLHAAQSARLAAYEVDAFTPDEYFSRAAIRS